MTSGFIYDFKTPNEREATSDEMKGFWQTFIMSLSKRTRRSSMFIIGNLVSSLFLITWQWRMKLQKRLNSLVVKWALEFCIELP
ncbi:hypothetical protein WDU94_013791 [Cyamophila willieti]